MPLTGIETLRAATVKERRFSAASAAPANRTGLQPPRAARLTLTMSSRGGPQPPAGPYDRRVSPMQSMAIHLPRVGILTLSCHAAAEELSPAFLGVLRVLSSRPLRLNALLRALRGRSPRSLRSKILVAELLSIAAERGSNDLIKLLPGASSQCEPVPQGRRPGVNATLKSLEENKRTYNNACTIISVPTPPPPAPSPSPPPPAQTPPPDAPATGSAGLNHPLKSAHYDGYTLLARLIRQ